MRAMWISVWIKVMEGDEGRGHTGWVDACGGETAVLKASDPGITRAGFGGEKSWVHISCLSWPPCSLV